MSTTKDELDTPPTRELASSHATDAVESDPSDSPPVWKPRKGQWLIFGCLALLSFIISLDTTVITPAIPVLEQSLKGDTVQAFWAGTSYLLTSAVCQPFIVDLSDVFGRREVLFGVVSLFTLGTILSAVAHDFHLFLAGRSLQGIGGGGIMASCIVITTDIVPLRQRPTYYAIVQMAWAIGTLAGPVVGGAIAQKIPWRWIFYINLPFCGLGLVMVPLTVRLRAERPSILQRLGCIDWVGGVLFIGSLCSFLIGITWGGNQFRWDSWRTIVPIVVGGVGCVVALLWEAYGARRPFIHLQLFASVSAVLAYLCACLQGALMLGLLYFIPLCLQTVKHFSPITSGLALMVILGVMLPASVVTGALLTRLGTYRWAIWSGWLLCTLAIALLTLLDTKISAVRWVFIFLTLGTGQGLILTSQNFAVQALAKDNRDASAAGLYTFMRSLGMCIGVAVAGTFFQNRLAERLGNAGLDRQVARMAAEFALVLRSKEGGLAERVKAAYVGVFREAFRDLWIFFAAVSGLSFLLALGIGHASMDRALESEHTLVGERGEVEVQVQGEGEKTGV
ncbi:MFS general substrate transporter [Aspergillus brunneoviolaceus CBS 621.78]|uniref:MFS general substrate transporter n=1 Tax=Aspergillus brunneoviolaceus CBS 621.78 TaxID=1450534 RepID=A0ACD1GPU2_9EURO|nr:MFS general substrate transporter [Aspergillus brunneoviolaceus CBS 621.78]RAH51263.1 MFS general substrate transporter [Aspergillus brunneoviolaceus CBS 621.78]